MASLSPTITVVSRAAGTPPRPDPAALPPPDPAAPTRRHPHAPAPFTAEFHTAPPVAAGPRR
ncbi:hypothetical protein AB0C15_10195 [Micromonospora sp. NPDC048835]|uniref:hypothetical protein n=1 Tax=Micromonospora sp. NPDC048835 TaxID=3155147 RepID=UPI0033DBEB4C